MMVGSRYRNLAVASAAAVLAVGLSVPAQAEDNGGSPNAAAMTEVSSAEIPTPRVRPAVVRKRAASPAPVYRPAEPYRVARPYAPVGARYTMLILGVGY
jgi:hypothetical protein